MHPGEILREEFLVPGGRSAADLATHLGRPTAEIAAVIAEAGAVTAELAWLLAMAFGTSPEFWTNLQAQHDLAAARPAHAVALF